MFVGVTFAQKSFQLGAKFENVCNFTWHCDLHQGFETLMSKSTLDHLFKILVWSFGCMASGKFPSKDWNGNEHFTFASGLGKLLFSDFGIF